MDEDWTVYGISVDIDHPEHGSLTVPPGWYAITFQRQYAEELRRVQD